MDNQGPAEKQVCICIHTLRPHIKSHVWLYKMSQGAGASLCISQLLVNEDLAFKRSGSFSLFIRAWLVKLEKSTWLCLKLLVTHSARQWRRSQLSLKPLFVLTFWTWRFLRLPFCKGPGKDSLIPSVNCCTPATSRVKKRSLAQA